MASSAAPRAMSQTMTTGSLRTRSISTPACSDTSANGSVSSATRIAHLERRGVQQQRGRERQREVRDLRAERRDRQRHPQLPEIRRPPEAAKSLAKRALQSIHDHLHLRSNTASGRSAVERLRIRCKLLTRIPAALPGGTSRRGAYFRMAKSPIRRGEREPPRRANAPCPANARIAAVDSTGSVDMVGVGVSEFDAAGVLRGRVGLCNRARRRARQATRACRVALRRLLHRSLAAFRRATSTSMNRQGCERKLSFLYPTTHGFAIVFSMR